jgi:hypothetical protein
MAVDLYQRASLLLLEAGMNFMPSFFFFFFFFFLSQRIAESQEIGQRRSAILSKLDEYR